MEGAEHGGERASGGLEDGGSASQAPGSPSHGCEGPQDESRSREAPGTEGHHRIDEGPGDNARSDGTPGCTGADEGPLHTGTSADEGPRRIDEGPRNTSRSHGTPSRTGTDANEGPKRTEGPHRTRTSTDEGPGDDSRSHGTPSHTRTSTDEGPCRIDEGPGDDSRSHGTPSHTETGTDEGPCHIDEGPGDDSRSHGTPSHTGTSTDEGPLRTRVGADEGLGDNSRGHETPSHSRTGADEGTRDVEGPRRTRAGAEEGTRHTGTVFTDEHEISKDPDVPRDVTASQRNAGAHATEGPHAPGTDNEGPHALRTSPSEELSDDGAPKELSDDGAPKEFGGDPKSWDSEGPRAPRTCRKGPHAPGTSPAKELSDEERPPAPGGHPSSFKKPVTPGRPSGHEKGLDPRAKPDGEAAPDVGLPSDAYRTSPAIPYREPPWSGHPPALYSLEILKGGAILSTKDLSGAAWTVFGRLPVCHVALEHPSVSRFHAVLQYRSAAGDQPDQERGFYVHDLGSTHGTFVNKQRIPPRTFCRIRVGHVMKFGGSTRLFILQGPEEDQEAESELTVTQIKEVRRQKEDLQKRMLGDDSDEEDEPSEEGKKSQAVTGEEAGCMWGMGEDAIEEENEENPIAMEFQEEREASYIKNPKKALQGFFDREGEELEFEYEERSPGSWLCRVKLPADDSAGKQLVAEVTHSGKKKDAANLCSLEACRMLEMRGLLRQEAVSRKRKAKKWEDEDFYDSDDDTFLDRTGVVEKKRLNRMKKAGKIEEKPETFESLSAKLELVEKEITEVAAKLKTSHTDVTQPSTQDSLDAFMTEIKAGSSLDSVSRKKLHLQSLELKKEQQRLKSLIKIVRPTKLPELQANSSTDDAKPKKLNLPMFGAMKGGSKFKLKTGTVGKLPPKRTNLPASLFTMKDTDEPEEEEEEDEDEQMKVENAGDGCSEYRSADTAMNITKIDPAPEIQTTSRAEEMQTASPEKRQEVPERSANARSLNGQKKPETSTDEMPKPAAERQKKMHGPSKPPRGVLSTHYPEDDPDYCVWTPPAGQSGDGKTHLNDKYGY